MESSSPMSFKLPVKVINDYKDRLEKKSSFKRSLTEEIKKMCHVLKNVTNHEPIIERIGELEKTGKISKKYVVTEVETSSSKILKDYRIKHDVTQSALLWLWIESNGNIDGSNPNIVIADYVEDEEDDVREVVDLETTKKVKRSPKSSGKNKKEATESKQKSPALVKPVDSREVVNQKSLKESRMKEIEECLDIGEYEGPTEEITLELPASTIEKFKGGISKGETLDQALLDEIRKMCRLIRSSEKRLIIVNHVRKLGNYNIDKVPVKAKVDKESLDILTMLLDRYFVLLVQANSGWDL